MSAHPCWRFAWAGALLLALTGMAALAVGCGGSSARSDGGAGRGGMPTGGTGTGGLGAGGAGGGTDGGAPATHGVQAHSGSLELSPDGKQLFVVHPDADSVSVIGLPGRTIAHEVLLAAAPPAADASGRFAPAVGPRALAHDSTGKTIYVTGQWSSSVYAVDVASGAVTTSASVCSEPIGVLVSADDANVFVACAQDDEVAELKAADLSVVARVACPRKPWALAWAADGKTLLATHFLGPGVSSFATQPLSLGATWTLADGPASFNAQNEPHGPVRGIYDAAVRPGSAELWVAHIMLGIDTPQPALDFQSTVFPSLTILDPTGKQQARLSVQANPGDGEAFGDVVSGPRAIAFSDDGGLAFVTDTDSEDVLVVDTTARVETQLVRPLPGHLPEGIVWANGELYVQERNSEDITAFTVTRSGSAVTVAADGAPFKTLSTDPMPATLRLGQKLFYSANSDDVPLTQNHWVACASCHLEGRSDAVTWKFEQGPRDTPTNAGGLSDTGFLFRTADRNQVQDYWKTINVEQGGHFSITDPTQKTLLDAIAAFVNQALPTPVPPSVDATHTMRGAALTTLRAHGATVFSQVGCGSCHSGPAKTDSGADNPTLDLTGPVVATATAGGVLLHDVGTCVTTGNFPDVDHTDLDGDDRGPCAFDTPALRGLTDSAPFFHDGSAATLNDVLPAMLQATVGAGNTPPALSAADQQALVE
ncbi:MAG TPA: beta-propeller fold lactonase family protein, partial [Jatrophihabitans sp.]|nr:beta-propeller fold lactonase family protein [Jatrophihabitans sp.]